MINITEIAKPTISQQLISLNKLIRVWPVISWGISSSLPGLGFAVNMNYKIVWLNYGLFLLSIILAHGVVSHAINDREDWLSGTDQLSRGILSGGSKVIVRGQFSLKQVSSIAKAAGLLMLIIAAYFIWQLGIPVIVFLIIAFWAAFAYSCPPLRLAYYPLLGEWLCALPAVAACTAGAFYLLTNNIDSIVVWAGIIHGLLAIGLLMHHHISDIDADLQAIPPKMTTVAFLATRIGIKKTTRAETGYFLLALLLGIIGGYFSHPVLWITVPVSLACIGAARLTDPEDIMSITVNEYRLYGLITADAIIKTIWLIF